MTIDALKQNLRQIKEVVRELYVFTNQLEIIRALEINRNVVINTNEKKLLQNAIDSLTAQLRILNNSIPYLLENLGFFRKLTVPEGVPEVTLKSDYKKPLVQIKYRQSMEKEAIAVTIGDKERKEFLENLSKSNLSINQLKNKYSVEKPVASFGKPNLYAKISNKIFRNFSQRLSRGGYLKSLNENLRKMNSPFVVTTYTSMIFFTMLIATVCSFIALLVLLWYNIGLTFPFFSSADEGVLARLGKFFWIVFAIPLITGILMYMYPRSEGKDIGSKINQELPFVTIHMSAIASSGVQPMNIFEIIIKSEEYRYTRIEFRKLLNLINFQGYDLITALKKIARSSPSVKLRELLDGLATAMTSGGELHSFLDKHADSLLFDYKLERERYTKTSETFMDIYISIVIAAPMILLMLFVIMGGTGMSFLGLSTEIMSVLIILAIVFLNIGFLVFLKLKQPVF